ncbi:hypothetical protein GGI07_002667 [Coemansia sp. Benny D115]|nr:hypothetical protein GGI07_002667 [Coemansia sp. Benny D115]
MSALRSQSNAPLRKAPTLKQPQHLRKAPRISNDYQWPEKKLRVVYHYVHDKFIDPAAANGAAAEINWAKTGARVGMDSETCKEMFYDLQRGLKDNSHARAPIWTREEIERVVRGAREHEKTALRAGTKVDWDKVAKEYTNGRRTPQECKRIYESFFYLCRTNINPFAKKIDTVEKALQLASFIGLACIILIFEPFTGMLFPPDID